MQKRISSGARGQQRLRHVVVGIEQRMRAQTLLGPVENIVAQGRAGQLSGNLPAVKSGVE